jgi:hypothetical protein
MTHALVEQLRFARSEWRRGLRGVPDADGSRHIEPMNSIGWIVGHMAGGVVEGSRGCSGVPVAATRASEPPRFSRGLMTQPIYPLCFREGDPRTNRVTYRLYRCLSQEHITPIERIPDSARLT